MTASPKPTEMPTAVLYPRLAYSVAPPRDLSCHSFDREKEKLQRLPLPARAIHGFKERRPTPHAIAHATGALGGKSTFGNRNLPLGTWDRSTWHLLQHSTLVRLILGERLEQPVSVLSRRVARRNLAAAGTREMISIPRTPENPVTLHEMFLTQHSGPSEEAP